MVDFLHECEGYVAAAVRRRREVGRGFPIAAGAALLLLCGYGLDLWRSHFFAYPCAGS